MASERWTVANERLEVREHDSETHMTPEEIREVRQGGKYVRGKYKSIRRMTSRGRSVRSYLVMQWTS